MSKLGSFGGGRNREHKVAGSRHAVMDEEGNKRKRVYFMKSEKSVEWGGKEKGRCGAEKIQKEEQQESNS